MKRAFLTVIIGPFATGILITLGAAGPALAWPAALSVLFFAAAGGLIIYILRYFADVRGRIRYEEQLIDKVMAGDSSPEFPEGPEALPLLGELGVALNHLLRRSETMLENERKQKLLQETILACLNEGIILTDEDGKVLFETPLAGQLLLGENAGRIKQADEGEAGSKPGAALNPYFYLRGLNAAYIWELMQDALKSGQPGTHMLELAGGEELRYVEAYVAPIEQSEEGAAPGALAVLRDVTHLKRLEQMRKDFVANVTHELKTPLTSIRGYIDLLKSRRRTYEEAEQFYTILDIEADRLQNLISDLLELSEIEGGDRQRLRNEDIYLYSIGDEVLSELSLMAKERKVALHLTVDPDFHFLANRHRIKQLIVNLVSNAVKYNTPGGDVWLSAAKERGQIRIQVRDNGIGIAKEHLPRLFERFYRVSKSRSRDLGGTGLGLAIVKHIAGLYGGTVQVASQAGKGTVFTIILPEVREAD